MQTWLLHVQVASCEFCDLIYSLEIALQPVGLYQVSLLTDVMTCESIVCSRSQALPVLPGTRVLAKLQYSTEYSTAKLLVSGSPSVNPTSLDSLLVAMSLDFAAITNRQYLRQLPGAVH